MTKIVVTGGEGQLARWVAFQQKDSSAHQVVALSRAELDIESTDSVEIALDHHLPDVVINAAAYTAVDKAEQEPERAHSINGDGAENISRECARRGIGLVHVSTDFVFDGEPSPRRPYLPADAVNPLSVYGRTKLDGERRVMQAHPESVVVRTSWLYSGPARERCGFTGEDFVTTIIRLGSQGTALKVVDDQYGSPTFAADLADALVELCAVLPSNSSRLQHYSGQGVVSRFEFARATFENVGLDPDLITRCNSGEFPSLARRPLYTPLDCSQWTTLSSAPVVPWQVGLEQACEVLGKST